MVDERPLSWEVPMAACILIKYIIIIIKSFTTLTLRNAKVKFNLWEILHLNGNVVNECVSAMRFTVIE